VARKWFGPPKEPIKMPVPGGTWLQRHPTRYGWDEDVRNLIDRIFKRFDGISINTYADHPEGWSAKLGYNTAVRSFDVLDNAGRGEPINRSIGDRVVDFVFEDPGIPYISWCIWEGEIWQRSKTPRRWRKWQDDGTGRHFDHPHFTMMPRGWRP
jgi:hypothetical protein